MTAPDSTGASEYYTPEFQQKHSPDNYWEVYGAIDVLINIWNYPISVTRVEVRQQIASGYSYSASSPGNIFGVSGPLYAPVYNQYAQPVTRAHSTITVGDVVMLATSVWPVARGMFGAIGLETQLAARGTQVGYHATRAGNVESILKEGLRSSTSGRAGSGVYVSNSAEGAMAEFAAHNAGVTPSILQVGYTPGTNYFLQGLTRSSIQGPIPLAADTISFGSVRLSGAVNTVIRNESATVLKVMP